MIKLINDIEKYWKTNSNSNIRLDNRNKSFYQTNVSLPSPSNGYIEKECEGRIQFLKAFLEKYKDWDYIDFCPLTSSFDLLVYDLSPSCIEIKKRGKMYSEVMMEVLKWNEAVEQGYSNFFVYSNIFGTGEIYSWVPSTLTLTPHTIQCPRSSVESRGKKEKEVYMLGIEKRRKDLDMLVG